ncbi:hypothetical protein [Corynebacterium sp. HMSC074H12]|uniref:hypothetical protein n=1 Tax=Corynebacterium sp. HMSC074H12 TaxID=1739436 RepID=UPI0008CAC5DB|nr:hypothetical protein [Corynebacterium sp. HMSC074H12]OFQ54496.1 hypothetical protein HMPREF2932_12735 [Corynebacterium sp. HMSC074H12]
MNAIAWTREATETEIADSILEAAGCTAENCVPNWDEDMPEAVWPINGSEEECLRIGKQANGLYCVRIFSMRFYPGHCQGIYGDEYRKENVALNRINLREWPGEH